MPINSTHPEYKERVDQWVRCRDAVEGSDAIKKKGVKYLPKLSGQSTDDYNAYKRRALFFSVSGRSLDGLVGMVNRRTATINNEPEMDKYFKDTDSVSMSFPELVLHTTSELLHMGRIFEMIDWPVDGGDPYIVTFVAEAAINWGTDVDGNLEWVVLKELVADESTGDMFDISIVAQYRYLSVVDGVYSIEIYDDKLVLIDDFIPSVSGSSLDFIPGLFINPNGIGIDTVKPPLLDIVDVNLSQYMTSADLEHGRHYTALPTPVVSGVNGDTVLKIGSQTAWAIPEKAKAYYLEFLGSGLASLEKAMAEKTSQMAQFSTRLMDTSTRGSEAADTVRLRHSSEAATLSSVASSVEAAMIVLYGWIADFEGMAKPGIELNKDFLDSRLGHAELKQLTESFISGAIDEETYFYNLYRGELVPTDKKKFDSKVVKPESKIVADDKTTSQNSPQE